MSEKNDKYMTYFKQPLAQVEKTLERVLPQASQFPHNIHEAMRYAVFPAGKRFRPLVALAACEACGGKAEDALIPAASLELIHSYSLVHDDLPALDNDDDRRGRPTCHKKYGEALAILAGDGLLTLAFHILAQMPDPRKATALLSEISTAAGTYGMIGGQVADVMTPPDKLNLLTLDYINIHKTGRLIKASAVAGAIAAGAAVPVQAHLARFGEYLGLAFQSIDDLLDGDGYLRLVKPKELRQKIRDLIAGAIREIRPLGRRAVKLQMLAEFLLKRLPRERYAKVD